MNLLKMIPGLKARDDSPEGHFRLIVYLTVFFFIAAYGMEIGNAAALWKSPVNTEIAKEAFHDFFLFNGRHLPMENTDTQPAK